MKPCPSCGWMLKDTDNACNMCGASVGGGAPAPIAAAPPPPAPVVSGGAYAPPGPPGMGGYPAVPPVVRAPGPVAPPPPVSPFGGAVAPPPPVSAMGPQPQPPPHVGPIAYAPPQVVAPGGGFGAAPANEAPFPVSPWARAAAPMPQAAPQGMPMPAAMGGPPVAPPAPIAMVPNAPAAVPAYAPPQPAIAFGQPQGAVAPPPMVPGPVARPGGIAPPPIVSAPPMVSPGVLGAAPAPVAPSGRVLVGFLVTFQNDPGGSFWPIHSGRTQLGRSTGDAVDIALQDASASSRHASLHADPATGQAFVEDDGSRNGSFLNEARLAAGERRQLRDNDRLRLGSTTFVVKLLVS